ncbi:MAG: hypothetical protein ACTSUG_17575, partial [Candidatus Helarchaeota archaeon]
LVFPHAFQYYKIITSFEILPQSDNHDIQSSLEFLKNHEKEVEEDLVSEYDIDLDILIEMEKEKLKKLK